MDGKMKKKNTFKNHLSLILTRGFKLIISLREILRGFTYHLNFAYFHILFYLQVVRLILNPEYVEMKY